MISSLSLLKWPASAICKMLHFQMHTQSHTYKHYIALHYAAAQFSTSTWCDVVFRCIAYVKSYHHGSDFARWGGSPSHSWFDFPMISFDFPMVFPFSYDFPMVFPFAHGFQFQSGWMTWMWNGYPSWLRKPPKIPGQSMLSRYGIRNQAWDPKTFFIRGIVLWFKYLYEIK